MTRRKRSIWTAAIIIALASLVPCWYLSQSPQKANLSDGLFMAIRSNDAAKVKSLLKAGADPNLRESPPRLLGPARLIRSFLDPDRNSLRPTPLLVALYHLEHLPSGQTEIRYNAFPNPEIVRALLDSGADANATDDTRTTPLFFGVVSGNTQVVDLLFKHGAKINQTDPIGTPLLLTSASQGRIEMMQYLLSHGADVKERNALGETALIHTVRYARTPDAVKFLLDHHIDVNAKDKAGNTALFYARKPDPRLAASQTRLLPGVIAELIHAGAQ
jgi:ankyrin repeat protein